MAKKKNREIEQSSADARKTFLHKDTTERVKIEFTRTTTIPATGPVVLTPRSSCPMPIVGMPRLLTRLA